jgi:RNA polymerase sigma-70 factor (ECF subfamily)
MSRLDFRDVYEREVSRVYGFFSYRGASRSECEDLTQATFERALRAWGRYDPAKAEPSTWLLTIARNVAIDHLRARQRHEPLDVAAAVPSPESTPEQQAVQQSEAQRLGALLATLEPRQRELMAMKYGADMTNRAIALVTGLSESNVGTILHRAVEALRDRW